MKESSNDIYTGTTYLNNNPDWNLEDAGLKSDLIAALLKKNQIAPSGIVDVGCGAGGVIHELSKKMPGEISFTGFDISSHAITRAKSLSTVNCSFFNEDYFACDRPKPDLLLLIDVVEHVDDYYNFLRKLRARSNFVVFHIPLDLSVRSMFKPHIMKQQRDAVGHIHYFSEEMVRWMLNDTGFTIIDEHFTKPVSDSQYGRGPWKMIKKTFRNMVFSANPRLAAKVLGEYSLLILAR